MTCNLFLLVYPKLTPNPAPLNYNLGLSLSGAPQIDEDNFVGRGEELAQLEELLSHTPTKQKIVALWGLGGIGKTQLSIHFARRHQDKYSSVIWLSAKDGDTLKADLVALASHIRGKELDGIVNQLNEDQSVQYIRQWLSEPENKRWLVIFDNYDDPRLFDIRQFFPHVAQGSILITTRSSRIRFCKPVQLRKLVDLHQSLDILAKQSCQNAAEGKHVLRSVLVIR
jgi:hypothetical protein